MHDRRGFVVRSAPGGVVFVAFVAGLACGCGGHVPAVRSDGSRTAPSRLDDARLIGRFERRASSARFAWSGSSFEARVSAPSVAMRLRAAPLAPHVVKIAGKDVALDEKTTSYSVFVDGRRTHAIDVSHETDRYIVASGLDGDRPHVVRVVRDAEAFAGVHEFFGFELPDGGSIAPSPARRFRVEVVGDSITCGYGIAGEDASCPFTYATERASLTYGMRVGDALDADVSLVCWSGRGVHRNYDGSTHETMPVLFERTLPEPPHTVAFRFDREPPPDAVVVSLGTNDLLSPKAERDDLPKMEAAYVAFLRRVRGVYPEAYVLVASSPMLAPEPSPTFGNAPLRAVQNGMLARVTAAMKESGDARVGFVDVGAQGKYVGCDEHPNEVFHADMARTVGSELRRALASQ